MTLSLDFASDWRAPYPFRVVRLESEHDAELGQWSVEVAILGIAATVTWVYAETELRKKLADMMADDAWLANSLVSMPHADYEAMKADADKWRESQK